MEELANGIQEWGREKQEGDAIEKSTVLRTKQDKNKYEYGRGRGLGNYSRKARILPAPHEARFPTFDEERIYVNSVSKKGRKVEVRPWRGFRVVDGDE